MRSVCDFSACAVAESNSRFGQHALLRERLLFDQVLSQADQVAVRTQRVGLHRGDREDFRFPFAPHDLFADLRQVAAVGDQLAASIEFELRDLQLGAQRFDRAVILAVVQP